jgi:hypothetical protein
MGGGVHTGQSEASLAPQKGRNEGSPGSRSIIPHAPHIPRRCCIENHETLHGNARRGGQRRANAHTSSCNGTVLTQVVTQSEGWGAG